MFCCYQAVKHYHVVCDNPIGTDDGVVITCCDHAVVIKLLLMCPCYRVADLLSSWCCWDVAETMLRSSHGYHRELVITLMLLGCCYRYVAFIALLLSHNRCHDALIALLRPRCRRHVFVITTLLVYLPPPSPSRHYPRYLHYINIEMRRVRYLFPSCFVQFNWLPWQR